VIRRRALASLEADGSGRRDPRSRPFAASMTVAMVLLLLAWHLAVPSAAADGADVLERSKQL
jgi:hypothetical protein